MKGKFILKVSVLIIELESSPNLKHYHVAERTGFEPVEPVAQLGSLANYQSLHIRILYFFSISNNQSFVQMYVIKTYSANVPRINF